jgi:hypothetical protein
MPQQDATTATAKAENQLKAIASTLAWLLSPQARERFIVSVALRVQLMRHHASDHWRTAWAAGSCLRRTARIWRIKRWVRFPAIAIARCASVLSVARSFAG